MVYSIEWVQVSHAGLLFGEEAIGDLVDRAIFVPLLFNVGPFQGHCLGSVM